MEGGTEGRGTVERRRRMKPKGEGRRLRTEGDRGARGRKKDGAVGTEDGAQDEWRKATEWGGFQ